MRIFRGLVALGALVAVGLAASIMYMRGVPEPDPTYGMPPLKADMADTYEYYKLAFLPDGYPGKKTDHGLVPHPIYGPYLIQDYLDQYAATKDAKYLAGARRVADAAIRRMQPYKNASVFWYTPEMALSSLPGTYYSGLTQSHYVRYFSALWKVTNDKKYLEAAERSLNSLTIPVSEGGVLRAYKGGSVIEEWPNAVMPDFTLNGWTTAMLSVQQFYIDTGSPVAKKLVDDSLVALDTLLPLYDVPELANSRYRLSGRTWTRILIKGTTADILSGSIEVPGVGTYPYALKDGSAWENYVREDKTNRQMMLNSVLNYVSYPAPNILHFSLHAASEGTATVELQVGDYEPVSSEPVNERWVPVGTVDLRAGKNDVSLSVPWETASIIIYPTNFRKKIGGKNYNSYHFIHIANLRRLAALSGDAKLTAYADKWQAYSEQWQNMPVYTQSKATLPRKGTVAKKAP